MAAAAASAPSLSLEVLNSYYGWRLPEGMEKVTALDLKEDFKARCKLLYHQRLRFTSEAGANLEDADEVPRSPAKVRVSGPDSVIKMLELALRKHFEGKAPVLPGAKAEMLSAGAPAASPMLPPFAGAYSRPMAGNSSYRRTPAEEEAAGRAGAASHLGGDVAASARSSRGGGYLPVAGGAPRYLPPREASRVETDTYQPVSDMFTGGLLQQQVATAEQRDLDAAILASRDSFQADEETQLAWALQESTRLAEAENMRARELDEARARATQRIENQRPEDIRTFYEAEKLGKERDDEGSDDDDNDLPPLEPIPDSEE